MVQSTSLTGIDQGVSAEEVTRAERYLGQTRDALVDSAAGLTPGQWNYKPAADRWSIGEIIEHVGLIEQRIHGVLGRMKDAPRREEDTPQAQTDELIVSEIPKRTSRFEAPEWVRPTGGEKGPEVIDKFVANRGRTIELVSTASPLRGHVIPHPIMGPWDGYQWLLAAAAHSARHTEQIREVKADPRFPRSSGAGD